MRRADGYVSHEGKKLGFGALAVAASRLEPKDDVPLRRWGSGGLAGQPLPRLDLPPKSDGSMRFAADVRCPACTSPPPAWHRQAAS